MSPDIWMLLIMASLLLVLLISVLVVTVVRGVRVARKMWLHKRR